MYSFPFQMQQNFSVIVEHPQVLQPFQEFLFCHDPLLQSLCPLSTFVPVVVRREFISRWVWSVSVTSCTSIVMSTQETFRLSYSFFLSSFLFSFCIHSHFTFLTLHLYLTPSRKKLQSSAIIIFLPWKVVLKNSNISYHFSFHFSYNTN